MSSGYSLIGNNHSCHRQTDPMRFRVQPAREGNGNQPVHACPPYGEAAAAPSHKIPMAVGAVNQPRRNTSSLDGAWDREGQHSETRAVLHIPPSPLAAMRAQCPESRPRSRWPAGAHARARSLEPGRPNATGAFPLDLLRYALTLSTERARAPAGAGPGPMHAASSPHSLDLPASCACTCPPLAAGVLGIRNNDAYEFHVSRHGYLGTYKARGNTKRCSSIK